MGKVHNLIRKIWLHSVSETCHWHRQLYAVSFQVRTWGHTPRAPLMPKDVWHNLRNKWRMHIVETYSIHHLHSFKSLQIQTTAASENFRSEVPYLVRIPVWYGMFSSNHTVASTFSPVGCITANKIHGSMYHIVRLSRSFQNLQLKGTAQGSLCPSGTPSNFLDFLEEKGLTNGFIAFPTDSHLICSQRT